MDWGVRKFVVGFLVLGALLGAFRLYTRLNQTPPIVVDVRAVPPELETDANAPEGQIGRVLGTDVRRVEQTQFFHVNAQSRVDRVFGFEELLHKRGDQWETTQPYMRVFLPGFRCDVTAERGKVRLETAFGRAMPSDAAFSGNVIIHVVPVDPNNPWEFFIRLDDVGFVAEKSLFSTPGPVRFLSRNAQLTGTGMELIYDALRNRLELFRIFDLESLGLRSSAFRALAGLASGPGAAGAPPVADAPKERGESEPNEVANRYQCVLHRHVTIETPEGTALAQEMLFIHNIFWSQSARPDATAQSTEPNHAAPPDVAPPEALNTSASSYLALESIPRESFDVVVACDGEFVLAPEERGSPGPAAPAAGSSARSPAGSPGRDARATALAPDRQHAAARRIDLDYSSRDTTLAGPVDMMFYLDPNALSDPQAGHGPMPMTVSAQQSVRYLAASNQVLLEGDCTVTLRRSEPNLTYEYTLTAPRFTLDLVSDPNAARAAGVRVRRFVTDGGPANLRIFRRGPDQQLLGRTILDAARLEYGADPREFTALGPGVLWVHNAELIDVQADPNRFSLGRPCYARLDNFDRLTYSMSTGRISAEARSRQLLLDYFPLTTTGYGRRIQAVAGHVEALLRPVAAGRMTLASLTASDGIDFEDEKSHFAGSVLFYDRDKDLVTVRGDAVQPCMFNGAPVDQIEMNLKTGYINAPISAPGVLQIRR
jgi:hypothetical protein